MSGKANPVLVLRRKEVGNVASVESAYHGIVYLIVANLAKDIDERFVLLTIDVLQFDGDIRYLLQSLAAKEIRRLIVRRQQSPLTFLCHRSQLLEVANEQELHTAERFVAVTVLAEFSIDGIKNIASHHGYLVDDKKVESLDKILLIL